MVATVKFKRGPKAGLGGAGCLPNNAGELVVTTDTDEVFIADGTQFCHLSSYLNTYTNGTASSTDRILIYDVSETGCKSKYITYDDLRTVLTPVDTDQKVKVNSDTTADYLDNILSFSGTGFSATGTDQRTVYLNTSNLVFDCGTWT